MRVILGIVFLTIFWTMLSTVICQISGYHEEACTVVNGVMTFILFLFWVRYLIKIKQPKPIDSDLFLGCAGFFIVAYLMTIVIFQLQLSIEKLLRIEQPLNPQLLLNVDIFLAIFNFFLFAFGPRDLEFPVKKEDN